MDFDALDRALREAAQDFALRGNDENLVVSDDANLARVFGLQFEKLWQQFA